MLENSTFLEHSTVIYTFTHLFTKCCEVWLFSETNKEIAKLIYEVGTLRNIIIYTCRGMKSSNNSESVLTNCNNKGNALN